MIKKNIYQVIPKQASGS